MEKIQPESGRRFIPAGAGNTHTLGPQSSPPTVHPRRRGEHVALIMAYGRAIGSSPQARGTQQPADIELRKNRFIPAGAGNTSRSARRRLARSVHPRRRGEHFSTLEFTRLEKGSSPQARGTRAGRTRALWCSRFIPAGAGNTCGPHAASPAGTVHPRRRGEHALSRLAGCRS